MKHLVITTRNSLEENIGLINFSVEEYAKNLKHKNAKTYLRYCFKQAVEYANLQKSCSIETVSLVQFYSLLNLVKTFVIININKKDITLTELDNIFHSHGASSKNTNDIHIKQRGTFVQFSRQLSSSSYSKNNYSLIELYKRIPDLYEYLPIVFHSEKTDYRKTIYCKKFMYEESFMNPEFYCHWLVTDKQDFDDIHNKYDKLEKRKEVINHERINKVVFSYENPESLLTDILRFDCDENLFIDLNSEDISELESIYLIFLKYSSLVRYKPKTWYEKINSKELLIIEKMTHSMFIKFWAYIAKNLQKNDFILI